MRRLLLFIVCFCCFSLCHAQNESSRAHPSVYSAKGFIVKKGSFKIDDEEFYYSGLYTADGKILVRMFSVNRNNKIYYVVAPGTETLESGSCSSSRFSSSEVTMPSSVKNLSPGSFHYDMDGLRIYDNSKVTDLVEEDISDGVK